MGVGGKGGGTGDFYFSSCRERTKLSGWLSSPSCILQLMICSEARHGHKARGIIYMFVPCLVPRRFKAAAHPSKFIQYRAPGERPCSVISPGRWAWPSGLSRRTPSATLQAGEENPE